MYVMGMDRRNQNDIITGAHDERIIQIVALSRLKDIYFATRCVDGDVSIWSASTAHPEKVFTIENID